jgi:hypothetical protein
MKLRDSFCRVFEERMIFLAREALATASPGRRCPGDRCAFRGEGILEALPRGLGSTPAVARVRQPKYVPRMSSASKTVVGGLRYAVGVIHSTQGCRFGGLPLVITRTSIPYDGFVSRFLRSFSYGRRSDAILSG